MSSISSGASEQTWTCSAWTGMKTRGAASKQRELIDAAMGRRRRTRTRRRAPPAAAADEVGTDEAGTAYNVRPVVTRRARLNWTMFVPDGNSWSSLYQE